LSSSFKIINASAGSGKTFSLVQNILKELFNGGDDSYKKILALTFTNNAANEMKKRILDELMLISEDYKSSKIFSLLKKELNISSSEAKVKAKRISNRILHNFSFFQVSTIDKFNHKIIRAFSQDLSLSGDFDLIIDQD
jgi:ATP-dependent exoDNAse (exonuclease V) beta subunit